MLRLDKEAADRDALNDAESYLQDSGIAFGDQDDDQRVYEQARRSRGRGGGGVRGQSRRREAYPSPPSSALPPLPPPPQSPPMEQQQYSPRSAQADKSYAELFVAFQRQQQAIARLRTANEEHAQNEEGLRADLLAMTRRYLQAQATVDTLEKRCRDAEGRAEKLALQLEEERTTVGGIRRTPELLSPRLWSVEEDRLRERRYEDRGDTATVSAGTVDSSDYVSVNLSTSSDPSPRPEIQVQPEEVLRLVRSINLQSHEVARACTAAANFRPGVRNIQADNKMVADLTEGIGCILIQMLHSRDHSKNKAIVDLSLRALLAYHVSKLVEDWPFHVQPKRDSRESNEGAPDESPNTDKEFGDGVESTLRDIATILTLSGSPGQPSSLIRGHRDRIGSTLDALLKTAESLAGQIKGGRFEGTSVGEYSFLYARPGATFNKELMQRHGTQQSMAIWKTSSKKVVQALCTREMGLARLHRTHKSAGSLSRTSSHSGSSSSGSSSHVREIEVLSKVIVVFESDLDK